MKQSVNYINHHKNVTYKMLQDDLSPLHISMYNCLFYIWNQCGFAEELNIVRSEIMQFSKIGSANTYTKVLKELDSFGYLKYKPSHNPLLCSKVTLITFDNTTDNTTDKTSSNSTDNTTDNTRDTYNTETIKLLNLETIKLIEKNVDVVNQNLESWIKDHNKKPKPKFEFAKSLIALGFEKKLVYEWMDVRKSKGATNSETAFNDFISQVEKSKKDKNEILKLCVIKSWRGFNHTWEANLNQSEPQKEEMFVYLELDSIDPTREYKAKESLYNEYIQQGRNIKFIRNEGV